MKIIQIGFNKCGTTTLHHLLHKNDIRSVHWDRGKLAQRIFSNLAEGKHLLSGYEGFQAFSDMEFIDGSRYLEGYKLFRELAAHYPDSVFILNTRDREAWIRSRFCYIGGRYAAWYKAHHRVASDHELAAIWRDEWDRHHRDVLEFFAGGKYRFFTWRIETDLPQLFAQHVPELDIDRRYYRPRQVSTPRRWFAPARKESVLEVPSKVDRGAGLPSHATSSRGAWLRKLRSTLLRRKASTLQPLPLPPRPPSQPSRYLAIAAIFKNEAPFLAEWVEFHRLVGVEHIFLYDNGSTDDWSSVLAPFIAQGFVTPIPWASFAVSRSFSIQDLQYAHALTNFGPDFRWMVNLDIDEFLFPVQEADLKTTLSRYEDLPAISAPWIMIGFSGHDARPEGLVIENFTMAAPFPPPRKRKGIFKWKTVLNPAEVVAIHTPHGFDFRSGMFGGGYDENRVPIQETTRYDVPRTANVLRINHYTTRSRSDFRAKVALSSAGRGSGKNLRNRRLKFATFSNLDAAHDSTILRFAPRLKQSLGLSE